MKKGIFCTEFWLAMVGFIGGGFLSVYQENPLTQILGASLAAICGPTYIAGRSWAKAKTQAAQESGRAVVAAARLQDAISGNVDTTLKK